MKMRKVVLVALAAATFGLGGCATPFPDRANPDAESVAESIHEFLDRETGVKVELSDARGRLLRAYFLITVFSVYGKASIERYSHSQAGDAGALLGRILAAETAFRAAWEDTDKAYYAVNRAKLIFATADLAARSVRPTATMFAGLIGTTPAGGAREALEIFKNAVKDVVYGEAYLEGFKCSIDKLKGGTCAGVTPKSKIDLPEGKSGNLKDQAWTEPAGYLQETCESLKQMAKLTIKDMKCGDLDKMKP